MTFAVLSKTHNFLKLLIFGIYEEKISHCNTRYHEYKFRLFVETLFIRYFFMKRNICGDIHKTFFDFFWRFNFRKYTRGFMSDNLEVEMPQPSSS